MLVGSASSGRQGEAKVMILTYHDDLPVPEDLPAGHTLHLSAPLRLEKRLGGWVQGRAGE